MDIIRIVSLDNVKTAGEFAGAIEFTVTDKNISKVVDDFIILFIKHGIRNFYTSVEKTKVTMFFSVQKLSLNASVKKCVKKLHQNNYSHTLCFDKSNKLYRNYKLFFNNLHKSDIAPSYRYEGFKYKFPMQTVYYDDHREEKVRALSYKIYFNTPESLRKMFTDMEHHGYKLVGIIDPSHALKEKHEDVGAEKFNEIFVNLFSRKNIGYHFLFHSSGRAHKYNIVMIGKQIRLFLFIPKRMIEDWLNDFYFDLDFIKTLLMLDTEFHLLGLVAHSDENIRRLCLADTVYPTQRFYELELEKEFGEEQYLYCKKKYDEYVNKDTVLNLFDDDIAHDGTLSTVLQVNELIEPDGKPENHFAEKISLIIGVPSWGTYLGTKVVTPKCAFTTSVVNYKHEGVKHEFVTKLKTSYIIVYVDIHQIEPDEAKECILKFIPELDFIVRNRKINIGMANEHQIRMLLEKDLCKMLPNFLHNESDIGLYGVRGNEIKCIKEREKLTDWETILERCLIQPRKHRRMFGPSDSYDIDSELAIVETTD